MELKELELEEPSRQIKPNIGLAEKTGERMAGELSRVLADSYLLMLKTHSYHWNVKGASFKTIHDLTEEQYTNLFSAIDEVAERIRALGQETPGDFHQYDRLSDLSPADASFSAMEMVADLLKSNEYAIKSLRKAADVASSTSDEVSLDLLVGRLKYHEKTAWKLRSLIEK